MRGGPDVDSVLLRGDRERRHSRPCSCGGCQGCIKGALVGGAAGHYAGHHGFLGAAADCVIGRHEAKKHAAQENQSQKAPTLEGFQKPVGLRRNITCSLLRREQFDCVKMCKGGATIKT